MKLSFWFVGKTDADYIQQGMEVYLGRLKHYLPTEVHIIPDLKQRKSLSHEQQKTLEGKEILKRLEPSDQLILLDERGKSLSSLQLADYTQKRLNQGGKRLVFVIGGPYGFSQEVYQAAQGKLSLSPLTFSHQMIRLFLVEQLYRSFTILNNEPYHHE